MRIDTYDAFIEYESGELLEVFKDARKFFGSRHGNGSTAMYAFGVAFIVSSLLLLSRGSPTHPALVLLLIGSLLVVLRIMFWGAGGPQAAINVYLAGRPRLSQDQIHVALLAADFEFSRNPLFDHSHAERYLRTAPRGYPCTYFSYGVFLREFHRRQVAHLQELSSSRSGAIGMGSFLCLVKLVPRLLSFSEWDTSYVADEDAAGIRNQAGVKT